MYLMFGWTVGAFSTSPQEAQRRSAEQANCPELLVPLLEEGCGRDRREFSQLSVQRAFQAVGHRPGVAMCPSEWFGEDVVDHTELQQVRRGHPQRTGRLELRFLSCHFPQDACAALRAD